MTPERALLRRWLDLWEQNLLLVHHSYQGVAVDTLLEDTERVLATEEGRLDGETGR